MHEFSVVPCDAHTRMRTKIRRVDINAASPGDRARTSVLDYYDDPFEELLAEVSSGTRTPSS